jgi:succinate-acetate transporter protein
MIFTIILAVASTVAPRVLTIVLLLTVVLLASLALANILGIAALGLFGGVIGIVTGGLAMYLAAAFLVNEMRGSSVLPVGAPMRS